MLKYALDKNVNRRRDAADRVKRENSTRKAQTLQVMKFTERQQHLGKTAEVFSREQQLYAKAELQRYVNKEQVLGTQICATVWGLVGISVAGVVGLKFASH